MKSPGDFYVKENCRGYLCFTVKARLGVSCPGPLLIPPQLYGGSGQIYTFRPHMYVQENQSPHYCEKQ